MYLQLYYTAKLFSKVIVQVENPLLEVFGPEYFRFWSFLFIFKIFFGVLGFELRAYTFSRSTSPFL
jgi:hypothetical protein